MPQSCRSLLFPGTLNDPQVFLTEVVVWGVAAAFPVCTSLCLQFQLSLSKQMPYQMVSCNYFTLSPLNCPGNKIFILFILLLFGNILSVESSASGTWICSGKSCALLRFCLFDSLL